MNGVSTCSVKNRGDTFDWGMHYLRAFAIVCILTDHLWCYNGMIQEAQAFLVGSTFYFLFISGYLCQYLAIRHPTNAMSYYRRKCETVVSPYFVWSALTCFIVLLLDSPRAGVIDSGMVRLDNLPDILLFGWAQAPYWYIPFVCILFLVSPRLSSASTPVLVQLFVFSVSLCICLPLRPSIPCGRASGIAFALEYAYFTWSYLLGFLYARLKQKIDPYLKAYAFPFFIFGMILGIGSLSPTLFSLFCPTDVNPSSEEYIVILVGPLARLLQKFFFLVPAVALANRFSKKRIRILDWLATCSFTLYFSHHFFVQDFVRLQDQLFVLTETGPFGQTILRLVLSILFIAFNLALAMTLKKLFGRRSRSFIGA